jgi:Flp pilus assembly protein TadD
MCDRRFRRTLSAIGGLVCFVGALGLTGPCALSVGASFETNHSFALTPSPVPDPQRLYQQARQALAAHEWSAAEQELLALLAIHPADTQASLLLGLLLAPVAPERALVWLREAEADPAQAEAARQVLAVLTTYQPFRADFYTALGLALCGLDEWALAERALRLAIEANAANAVALAYLGYAVDRQGEDGWPWLQQARAMDPLNPQVLYLVGLHWRQAGDLAAARRALQQAYWVAPDNPALAAEIGQTLQAAGDLAGAEHWLRIAVGLVPQDVLWAELLATFYAETGYNLEGEGVAFLQRASADFPDSGLLRACLGWVTYRQGDAPAALEQLVAAVELAPTDARAQYYLGAVQEHLGRLDEARQAYSAVLSVAPRESYYGELAARGLARLSANRP